MAVQVRIDMQKNAEAAFPLFRSRLAAASGGQKFTSPEASELFAKAEEVLKKPAAAAGSGQPERSAPSIAPAVAAPAAAERHTIHTDDDAKSLMIQHS